MKNDRRLGQSPAISRVGRERFERELNECESRITDRVERESCLAVGMVALRQYDELVEAFGIRSARGLAAEAIERYLCGVVDLGKHDVICNDGRFSLFLTSAVNEEALLARLNERIQQIQEVHTVSDGLQWCSSVSVAYAVVPEDGETLDALTPKLMAAMRVSRHHGFNKVVRTSTRHHLTDRDALYLYGTIGKACQADELFLEYQPKVDARQGRVVGGEALVRWNHPTRGRLGPENFIPIAERSGEINAVGRWVITNVLEQVVAWHRDPAFNARISFNVSPLQLRHPRMLQFLIDTIGRLGIDPAWIQIELTESNLIERVASYEWQLRAIASLGISVALDDFGKGYSSLGALHSLPIDTVKLDRALIRRVEGNPRDGELARHVISLCRSLGLQVVCEGIENYAQVVRLRELGAHLIQGYYYSPPIGPDAFADFAAKPQTVVRGGAGMRVVLVVGGNGAWSPVVHRLQANGYVVFWVRSAEEGYRHMASHPGVDVLIANYHLPGMDGLQFLCAMRDIHPGKRTILATDHNATDAICAARLAQVECYIGDCLDEVAMSLTDGMSPAGNGQQEGINV